MGNKELEELLNGACCIQLFHYAIKFMTSESVVLQCTENEEVKSLLVKRFVEVLNGVSSCRYFILKKIKYFASLFSFLS